MEQELDSQKFHTSKIKNITVLPDTPPGKDSPFLSILFAMTDYRDSH